MYLSLLGNLSLWSIIQNESSHGKIEYDEIGRWFVRTSQCRFVNILIYLNKFIVAEKTNDSIKQRNMLKNKYKLKAKEICPNDDERLNIILDMCYGYKNNKQFCYDTIGDLIVKRLEELKDESN